VLALLRNQHVLLRQVKVPNHTLFIERIYNLTETAGAVHEFLIAFNMFGRDNTNMVRGTMVLETSTSRCV
jgi:hypothetical protein